MPRLTFSSEVTAPSDRVWERVASVEGVNHELGPLLRMTAPRGTVFDPATVPVGRRWFRSWVFLLWVVPFDYDDLCLERIEPGRGFLERSKMLSARVWEHERTLEPLPGGRTRVTDRLMFVPRIPGIESVHGRVIAAIFRHRHRRLRRWFA